MARAALLLPARFLRLTRLVCAVTAQVAASGKQTSGRWRPQTAAPRNGKGNSVSSFATSALSLRVAAPPHMRTGMQGRRLLQ
jgi:hypothetical protein